MVRWLKRRQLTGKLLGGLVCAVLFAVPSAFIGFCRNSRETPHFEPTSREVQVVGKVYRAGGFVRSYKGNVLVSESVPEEYAVIFRGEKEFEIKSERFYREFEVGDKIMMPYSWSEIRNSDKVSPVR